ncbi:MAG TPA: cation:proton antiporter [Candidatus Polarisedimenticolaceae bacterium]
MSALVLFLALLFAYSLVSRKLEGTVVTAPMLFAGAGFLFTESIPALDGDRALPVLLTVAEVGLVLLLFADASRVDLKLLRSIRNLPVRLLSTGMLLTIALGAAAAKLLFPQLSVWEAGILAAILAPTDAGLGQIIVNSPKVPPRVRQALNVEAGLNDGLSVPFLLFFMALSTGGGARLLPFVVEQLGYGALVGLAIGGGGGWLLAVATRRGFMADASRQIGVVALPLACVLASNAVGASMFIAAFVAGLAVQVPYPDAGRHSVEFTEEWGQVLNSAVFFLFGLLVAGAWRRFDARVVVYAVSSLTVVRMLPVAIALAGTRLRRATVVFMGWFGPRGLASIVLGLVYLEEVGQADVAPAVRLAVMMTVLLSIFAHGLSAAPGIGLYARSVAGMPPDAPERRDQNEKVTPATGPVVRTS